MTRLLLPAALLLWLLAGPLPAQDEKPKQDPPKTDEQDKLKKRTQEMQTEMTGVRGLQFKTDVKLGIYTKDELAGFIKTELDRELPRDKAKLLQKAYVHFGLLPKDLDLYDALVDLYSSSIAGFYHPKTKEMRLVRPGDGRADPGERLFEQQLGVSLEDITLVHELCHAAQDQNFELTTLPMEEENNDDLVSAIKGLVEGDASATGWKFGLKKQPEAQFELTLRLFNESYKDGMLPGKAGELPAYLRKTLTFPYGYGTEFVLAVWRNGEKDWASVSKMFDDPPSSTEQILHPEKYFLNRDNPTMVSLENVGKVLGDDWKEVTNNVHGEYVIRILLGEFKAQRSREMDRVAAGWDGDRFHTLERDGKLLTVWYTTWDSEQDANEFLEGYAKLIAVKYEGAVRTDGEQKVSFDAFKQGGGHVLVERRSADVLVIDGANAAVLGSVNAIWDSARKTELKKVERLKLVFHCPKHAGEDSSKPGKCGVCGEELKRKKEVKDY